MQRPRLRLLLIVNALTPSGGAEIQLAHLARGLAERGHEVTLCCMDDSTVEPQRLMEVGVKIVELRVRSRAGRAKAIPRLMRLARKADVVQCTMWDSSLWGRIAAIAARRPVIVADHATDRSVQVSEVGASRAGWIAAHNRILDRFTFATVICASSQRPVLIGEGVSPEKIVHVPNGIPIAELAEMAADGPTREDLGLPAPAPLAIQVGVFRAEKNQLGALEAIRRVRATTPDAQLVFVGDGPMEEEVKTRAAELGAERWAHFLGHRSDVPGLLQIADLMLQPSTSDAMPMTVLEAMALGVPILATDVGDVRRMLGDAGACVPAGDADALAKKCAELLSDSEERARLGRAGIERARAYGSAQMVSRYESLFEAACSATSPAYLAPSSV